MKARAITPDLKVELMEIGALMHKKGLPSSFIAAAVETAFEFEGVYDLMKMWADEKDKTEQDEIVADIQALIDDCLLFSVKGKIMLLKIFIFIFTKNIKEFYADNK